MSAPVEEAVDQLYHQAASVIDVSVGAQGGGPHVSHAYQALTTFAHYGEHFALGLFPLALVLFILHEHYLAGTSGANYRVGYVLGRTAIVAAALLAYGQVCWVITYAAGGHGGWMSVDQLLGGIGNSTLGLGSAWSRHTSDDAGLNAQTVGALFLMLPIFGVWLIVVCAMLFAYVAGVLLSLSQGVLLAILLAVGKTCITVTLVPGVGLGVSWARSLAKVAAWSTIAGIIASLMVAATPNLREMLWKEDYIGLFKTAAQFIVLGACTIAVPTITERIFSGGAPHVMSLWQASRQSWQGLKMVSGEGWLERQKDHSRDGASGGRDEGGGGHDGSGCFYKVAPARLREGLATAGAVAAAPLAAAAALVAGREPVRDVPAWRTPLAPGEKPWSAEAGDALRTAYPDLRFDAADPQPLERGLAANYAEQAAVGPRMRQQVVSAFAEAERAGEGGEVAATRFQRCTIAAASWSAPLKPAEKPWSDETGAALRKAYPDLKFDPANPQPLERGLAEKLAQAPSFPPDARRQEVANTLRIAAGHAMPLAAKVNGGDARYQRCAEKVAAWSAPLKAGEVPWSAADQQMLRAAYPDLKFDPTRPQPLERGLAASLQRQGNVSKGMRRDVEGTFRVAGEGSSTAAAVAGPHILRRVPSAAVEEAPPPVRAGEAL